MAICVNKQLVPAARARVPRPFTAPRSTSNTTVRLRSRHGCSQISPAVPCPQHSDLHKRLEHQQYATSVTNQTTPAAISHLPGNAVIGATLATCAAIIAYTGPASARSEKVGEFAASGLLFKDTVEVVAIDDPEVDGVTIYLSEFKRSLADKLSKDFFSEPSQASLGCAISGPVLIKDEKRISNPEGMEVFSEKKGLNLFKDKTTRVRRLYDPERRTVLYVAYSTRLSTAADDGNVSTGRYRTSVCAVHLPDPQPAPALAAAAEAPVPANN